MVSNYTPTSGGCKTYNYTKLKEVVYLVSADHVKDIHIDNGEAYIDGLSELPLRINGFTIQFTEEESLDERYKFQKTLTLSMHGYVNTNFFGQRFYAIIETNDGTFYMVNVDFPSKVTHTFNLAQDTNQTDFTFSSLSNFPTLKLAGDFEAVEPVCLGYNVNGVESLKLIVNKYAVIDAEDKAVDVYGGHSFSEIEFLGESCSLQETFDGETVTDTITFNIGFDAYKSSWHYNLLEFTENLYSAIITPKGGDNKYFLGFNYGLQPAFTVQTSTEAGESDIITVTLTESSMHGMFAVNDYSERQKTDTRWRYVKNAEGYTCFECVDMGTAQYLVQQEVDGLGNPTGDYKVLRGYENMFPNLHIIGTFDTVQTFQEFSCLHDDSCVLDTTMYTTIWFNSATCYNYRLTSTCDWHITHIPEYLTINPSSGMANTDYTVTICNTIEPSAQPLEDTFLIHYGTNVRVENVKVTQDTSFLKPVQQNINCLAQDVTFTFDGGCPISIVTIDPRLDYSIGYSTLTVRVPRNYTTSGVTWGIVARDCNGNLGTVYINQDKTYEKWVGTMGYICENGNSYVKEVRYTGTTSTDINVQTSESRAGVLITSGDTRCQNAITKFEFDGNYYCIDGNKMKALEEMVSYDDGVTWDKTGVTRLGDMVEASSDFCDETLNPVTYSWVLRYNKSQCYGGE